MPSNVGCASPHPADPMIVCELLEGHGGLHAALTWVQASAPDASGGGNVTDVQALAETVRDAVRGGAAWASIHGQPTDQYAEGLAALDGLVLVLDRQEAQLAQLRDEREIGPQTQRCDNPDCPVRTTGTGYKSCPKCAGELSAVSSSLLGETDAP